MIKDKWKRLSSGCKVDERYQFQQPNVIQTNSHEHVDIYTLALVRLHACWSIFCPAVLYWPSPSLCLCATLIYNTSNVNCPSACGILLCSACQQQCTCIYSVQYVLTENKSYKDFHVCVLKGHLPIPEKWNICTELVNIFPWLISNFESNFAHNEQRSVTVVLPWSFDCLCSHLHISLLCMLSVGHLLASSTLDGIWNNTFSHVLT